MTIQYKFMPLNNGFKVPVIGFSTKQLNTHDIEKALLCAIDAGYRYIDCASMYQNEFSVGLVLKMKIEQSGLNRADFCISSKLICTDNDTNDVRKECENSLQNLGVKYLDLYFLHWPISINQKLTTKLSESDSLNISQHGRTLEETWREMEKLVDAGLVKSIGLSNFNQSQIDRLIKICYIKPVMLQIESSVNFLNKSLVEYAQSYGIQVTALGTFGLTQDDRTFSLFSNKTVLQIAKTHRKSPDQILIRHALQRELIVLTHSIDPERIRFNLNVFDFELTKDEMDHLNNCGTNTRLFICPAVGNNPQYPFKD